MKAIPLLLICAAAPLASCDEEGGRAPRAGPRGAVNVVGGNANASNAQESVIRPEVVNETIAAQPAAPAQPLRATIPFGTSGLTLDDAGRARIDQLIAEPGFPAGGSVMLSGHTDSRGTDADNLVASRRRAEAVRDYLLSKGVAESRITVHAVGEARPLEPNAHPDGSDFPAGREANRRVEIVVQPPEEGASAKAPPEPAGQ